MSWWMGEVGRQRGTGEHRARSLRPIRCRPGSHFRTALPTNCASLEVVEAGTAFLNLPGDFAGIWRLLKCFLEVLHL